MAKKSQTDEEAELLAMLKGYGSNVAYEDGGAPASASDPPPAAKPEPRKKTVAKKTPSKKSSPSQADGADETAAPPPPPASVEHTPTQPRAITRAILALQCYSLAVYTGFQGHRPRSNRLRHHQHPSAGTRGDPRSS